MIRTVLGLGAAACLLVGTTAGGASAALANSIWQVVPSENPQPHLVTDSEFAGVSMGSATDGWTVGSFLAANAVGHPLVEHWDGTAWIRVPAPTPSGRQAGLAGVDELSTGNAWAVGDSANGSPGEGNIDDQPLIEHWNGSAWSIVNGVTLPSGSTGVLNAIGGTGPGDLWAVGYTLNADATLEQVLFEHFDGTSWQQAAFPTQTAAATRTRPTASCSPRRSRPPLRTTSGWSAPCWSRIPPRTSSLTGTGPRGAWCTCPA